MEVTSINYFGSDGWENCTEFQKKVDELNSELCEIESYNPYSLTKEKIQEIVKKYGK